MQKQISSIVASLGAGILLALMMQLNASLGEAVGPLESSFVVHVIGTAFAFLLIFPKLNKKFVQQIKVTPVKLFSCGIYGVLLVLITNLIVPHLGMVLAVAIFITSNLIFSVVADHFGFLQDQKFHANPLRVLGLLCSLAGLALILI